MAQHILRLNPGKAADLGLQKQCPSIRLVQLWAVRVTRVPTSESVGQRHNILSCPLVRVGHDASDQAGPVRPLVVRRGRAKFHHGMTCHGRRELGIASPAQPLRAGCAVTERLEWVIVGQHLVEVVKQRGGIDSGCVDEHAAADHGSAKEGGHFRHRGRVAQQL